MSDETQEVAAQEVPPTDHRADDAALAYSDEQKLFDCREALKAQFAENMRLRGILDAHGIEAN